MNKIILFGSRAIGDHSKKSDIDLAIVVPKMQAGEWTELTFMIEEELDTLPFIDLEKMEDAAQDLKKEIMDHGILLYSDEAFFTKDMNG